jgi:hypothetical protein
MATHHSHRFARLLVAGLAAGALAAPAAVAQPIDNGPSPATGDDNPPVVRSINDGFDGGSAAIGAGAAGAAFVLALGGVAYVTRDRARPAP